MPDYFFDTSAIGKRYHAETGTAKVDALFATGGASHTVSRLGVVELYSVFAKKVRTGHLAQPDFERLTRRFRQDVRVKVLRVVRLTVALFESAVDLIRRVGPGQNLRTLDALQLAVALDLNDAARPVAFVCADAALAAVAAAEGLTVINPERP
jgi:predicted nucleic acid-binding protein